MTRNEVIDLLTLIAAYDQRTIGEADVAAWLAVAEDEAWTYPRARRAVRTYHRRDRRKPRITPASVSDTINTTRHTLSRQLIKHDLVPPRELRDDPRAEIAWRRTYAAELVDRALDAWADGQAITAITEGPEPHQEAS